MVLQVSTANEVAIYSITSAGKSAIPDWLASQKKKALKHDDDFRTRIELIQDFDFPEASLKMKLTPDGRNIVATGTYKPQMRVFELNDLAMKFDRHTDAENVQFQILSDDWTKVVMLQNDRTIEFHTQSGMHYKTRIPKFGRDIAYHFPTCDVLAVGASNEVYRINLEQGRFMTPMVTDSSGINVCDINPAHHLFGFGGDDGRLEFFHPSSRERIGVLNVAKELAKSLSIGALDSIPEISSLKFANDGLTFAVGTSTGQVLLYDLRNPSPILIKDHQYGYPIKSLNFHDSGKVFSADTKIVKIWDKDSGKIFTNIEPPNDINDVMLNSDSGLVMVANEGVKIQSYYIPSLGPAPSWCPFLDNLTEELEEKPNQTIYDDYKFVTRKELNKLNMDHLVGSNVLKAYMHGFFIDLRLYEKAKAIANPFDYEEYRRQQIQTKIEKERSTRISAIKKLPKINKNLAQKLLDSEETSSGKKKRRDAKHENATSENPTGDSRFKELFMDPDYQVDEEDIEYKLRHPARIVKPEKVDDRDSDSEQEIVKPAKKVAHPLLVEKEDDTKELSFGARVSDLDKKRNQDRMSGSRHGNASVTFSLPKGQKRIPKDDSAPKSTHKKRGVGSLRISR